MLTPGPRATAAVLTYNGRKLLEVVLPSLAVQRCGDLTTLVIDNGSTDDTLEWLREHWPAVRVVALTENVGVTTALNVCLTAGDSELVALLNNDVELDPDCIGELVRALDEHPDAGSACAKLIDYHDRTRLDGAGDVFLWTGEAHRRGQGDPDEGQYDEPQEVFGACGGAALYRRTALERVGLFDERLYAIKEDVDWAFRARLAGFSCRYVPSAVAYHMGGATTGRDRRRYGLLQRRNQILVPLKSFPLRALLRHAPKIVSYQAGWVVAAAHEGMLREQLRALWAAILATPRTLRKRRGIECRVSLAYLDSVMSPVPYAGQRPLERARGILSELRR